MRPDLVAKQLTAAMAAIEAAFSLLEIEEEQPKTEDCPHELKQYVSMGRWVCEDCGENGAD